MTNEERAAWGRKAMAAGAPDQSELTPLDVGVDVITNVLHALSADGVMVPEVAGHVTGIALAHYGDEIADAQEGDLIVTKVWKCGNCGAALLARLGEEPSEPCQSCGKEEWVS